MAITIAMLGAGAGTAAAQAGDADAPAQPESAYDVYQAEGPWEVTQTTADVPAASGVTVFHPVDLGADGYEHPILTVAYLDPEHLTHLASWGFVVVRTDVENPGAGDEILAAAEWMIEQNDDPSSAFFGTLDPENVGAAGFSQGAGGTVHATVGSGGLISSTVPIALPNRVFWACEGDQGDLPWWVTGNCDAPPPEPAWDQLTGSVLYITGTADWTSTGDVSALFGLPLGSYSCLSLQWIFGIACNPDDQQYFYNQTPAPAARVEADGIEHEVPLFYMGYLTAWFKYTLEGDDLARTAFADPDPEIASDPAWTMWRSKGLP